MTDDIIKRIKEKFDSLPKEIQDIILSSNYQDSLLEIGRKYQLNVEQMGIMEQETTIAMMGLTPTTDFEKELTRELNIDSAKSSEIAKDISEKIFFKIRELLKSWSMGTEIELAPEKQNPVHEEMRHEVNVLSKAGIELVPEKLELTTPEKPIENREHILGKIEKPEEIHPILTQKITSSFQAPIVKTEHTLENITKTSAPAKTNTPPAPSKVDPYREIPE